MESPITMGEAGDNVCKEKSTKPSEDVCVNGDADLGCEEAMEICAKDSKAPEVNSNKIDSLKNCEKVPENEVPNEEVKDSDDEPMEVDAELEEENGVNEAEKDEDNEDVCHIEEENEEADEKEEEDKDSGSEVEFIENHDKLKINSDLEANAVNGNSVNGTKEDLDDDDEDVKSCDKSDSEKLDDSGDIVLVENDSEHRENGEVCSSPEVQEIINLSDRDTSKDEDVINLISPSKKKAKKISDKGVDVTPRRSSRNLNKQRSYVEKEVEEEEPAAEDPAVEDPDIEEVTPEDPLADPLRDDKENKKVKHVVVSSASSTIVVSDTKRLVEIAANSKSAPSAGKKEPTLVIIDTNSILSGRGPVPVASHKPSPMSTSFSMMPVALPAQGVYPPNMRATITPIPMSSSTHSPKTTAVASISAVPIVSPVVNIPSPSQILPTLTDDMYVVEAPSFIVPYVYEKPPIKPFKEFVAKIHKDIQEQAKLEAELEKQREQEEKDKKGDDSDEEKSDEDSKDSSKISSKKEQDILEKKKKEDAEKALDLDEILLEKMAKTEPVKPKSNSYFDNALGQFFMNIGYGLVQEYVQTDLLKQQKRKQKSEGGAAPETKMVINSLIKNLEYSKENNEPYKLEQKRCEFCSFKSESSLVLAHHLETPHMRNYVYKCNFCPVEVRSPHDILFHMEAEHNTRGRLERAPAFHQCPNCTFEENQKGKLSRHMINCAKKFKPERNLEPPIDWEPPAKIPRVPRVKQQGLQATAATYQALAQAKGNYQLFSKLQQASSPQTFPRGRGRPSLMGKVSPIRPQVPMIRTMYRPGGASGSILMPASYQFSGNQLFQVVGGGQTDLGAGGRLSAAPAPVALVPNLASSQSTVTIQNSSGKSAGKVVQQPSISITPLPRQPANSSTTITKTNVTPAGATVTVSGGESSSSKATFVICEICDGYIKDLEQLRNHMQWIHKVKIHPKMIYNRPPLNCQKCQFRFFTDQGLERHLLGSHGLVTSSMQEAANKSKDAGRCPVCGRVYQWKLLNHVARDHNMTLKPAHLSYKCTVCTATFGMYKQFENHVYSAHSVVAKRVMEKKSSAAAQASGAATISSSSVRGANDSLLKPLKINDEITIIPQPTKSAKAGSTKGASSSDRGK